MKVIVGEVTTRKLRLAGTVGLYGMSPRQFVMENVMDAKPSASKMHYIVNRLLINRFYVISIYRNIRQRYYIISNLNNLIICCKTHFDCALLIVI